MPPSNDQRPGTAGRFSEEQATRTLNSGQPDLETGLAAIRNILATLGTEPGVYRMLDAQDEVLYVGKAKSLKHRVANYTQLNGLSRRIQRMVSQTRQMTVVLTRSESEALLLEAQLIKRFRPPYNVLLRDDKSFPYIALNLDSGFPRLTKHRGARKEGVRYFGPFASASAVNETLTALQKVFQLRSCTDNFFANRSRPCLMYQIRRCSAPCVGRIDKEAYAEQVSDALQFLTGRSQQVQRKLTSRMQQASEALDYELAAVLRDRLKALTTVQGTQAVNAETDSVNADILAVESRDAIACVQVFFIRNGQNWGHRAVFPAHVAGLSEAEILSAFLGQFYSELMPAPQLLLDRELPEQAVLEEALSIRLGRKVELRVPQRGHLKRLVDQAKHNAAEAVDRRLAESATQQANLRAIADLFALEATPERIEIYDNSHIQGANALGAMVVATPAGFAKSQYRKFNMKQADLTPGDDFAMMRAMLTRRFARLQAESAEGEENWPDLLLIDGGKGQVSVAKDVLAELGMDEIPIVGMAQGADKRANRDVFHLANGRELTLPPNDPLLFFLERLRDEAHRFAIGAHRQKRSKAMVHSSLDDVPGIGPARKKQLLLHFGTARAVRGATIEELSNVPGISRDLASSIHGHFHAKP